jgi:leucyl aminopeptidase
MKPSEIIIAPRRGEKTVPVVPVTRKQFSGMARQLNPTVRRWLSANSFESESGKHVAIPASDGGLERVLWGLGNGGPPSDPFAFGRLARLLPAGTYRVEGDLPDRDLAALGWVLESYAFTKYRSNGHRPARLVCASPADRSKVILGADAHYLARDLINTPSSDMGPAELAAAARDLAHRHGAKFRLIVGRALERDFPLIHGVGKASTRAPRLIDFTWGSSRAPKVTLVGKGVCFDTGGLDIKPASNMLLMKKDMAGAACVLALAHMIMSSKLAVRLRVLIPAVENAISGNAFRPGDVLHSHKGLKVEIGNTDAEGRLVLADALALADREKPDLMVDMATLTGAARVAVGPDIAPYYTRSDELARELDRHGSAVADPVWRLPLWDPYLAMMESRIADINNAAESSFAGSITAALFLHRFVENARNYIHFDIFGWVPTARPGRPKGGEAQAVRALYALISSRYSK